MARKYKLTGCAKFFIFFIIAAPLAYIGASYYNGQNPFQKAKEFVQSFSIGEETAQDDTETAEMDQNVNAAKPNSNSESVYKELDLKDLEIKNLNQQLEDCKTISDKRQELIETQKQEIKHLNQQLEAK